MRLYHNCSVPHAALSDTAAFTRFQGRQFSLSPVIVVCHLLLSSHQLISTLHRGLRHQFT